MRKVLYLLLTGLLLTGAAGGPHSNVSSERPSLTPLAPSASPKGPVKQPSSPPYTIYLPVINKRYLAGNVAPFGIDMYAGNANSDGQIEMQTAGAGWETVILHWNLIEPSAPISGVHSYDWTSFDWIDRQAQNAGVKLFVLVTDNPSWATTQTGGLLAGPVNPGNVPDLNSFAAAAAERYDGDGVDDFTDGAVINDWSFYPEPDNHSLNYAQTLGKGYWGDKPNEYGDMIGGVANAMHAANPNAVVTIGGLAYDYFSTDVPAGPFVRSFLGKTLLRLNNNWGGAARYLGAVAFHYYPISTARWPTIKEKTAEIRMILTAHGVGNLPLFVPEMGYWSASPSSEPLQATTLVQMFVRGLSVGLQEMSWFMVFDSGPGTELHGLFRGTDLNSPKPSYAAYSTLTAELYGAKYVSALSGGGIEGYVFDMGGGHLKTVVWATQPSALVVFHQACLRRVDYLGNITTPINDGNATWDKDHVGGQITLQVQQNQPIYVGGC